MDWHGRWRAAKIISGRVFLSRFTRFNLLPVRMAELGHDAGEIAQAIKARSDYRGERLKALYCVLMVCVTVMLQGSVLRGQENGQDISARSEWTRINPVTALSRDSFTSPPMSDWPWVRLNIPETADSSELQAEVQNLYDHGIGGIEVGQGAFPNNAQLIALLSKANQLGIKVSLSHGPTQYPSGYSIDDDNARKTLVFGNAVVAAGTVFDGAIPPPHPPVVPRFGGPARGPAPPSEAAPAGKATLIALLAYRCSQSPCAAQGAVDLDKSSVIDLTDQVTGENAKGVLGGSTAGEIRWTAPSSTEGAQWQLISFWSRGVFAQPDPFSDEGLKQLISSMETTFSPEVKELMKANGGDIFYDSHSVDRGVPDELWTNQMPAEFSKRRHYSLISNLAALFADAFSFSDGSAPRVRDDLYAVRGDIWVEKQIIPLKAWTRKYNYALRLQPEGEMYTTVPINDQVQAASALDRPEHESLFANDEVDNYLPIASANHMTGNSWYSTECCAVLNMNYAETFKDVVIRMHKSYAGGITKLVYHVYPYRDSPTSKWPGFHIFGQDGFSNAWGPRNPNWTEAHGYNRYFSRLGQVLTQGEARTDVAVYMQNYVFPQSQLLKNGATFRIWHDTKLQEAGYTRDYLSPDMLNLKNAVVTAGRLAANGPSYKALIVDAEQEWPTDPVKTSMPIDVARKILQYAKGGLPIIVVSTPPDRTPGLVPASDDELQSIVRDMLKEPGVYRVAHESDVPAKLRSLGIHPSAEPESSSPMLSIHRHAPDTGTEYYYLYNQGEVSAHGEPANLFDPPVGQPLDSVVSLEGHGVPYLMDAWSGTITPIAEYSADADHVRVHVKLSRENAQVIVLAKDSDWLGVHAPKVHVQRTSAPTMSAELNSIVIRTEKTGVYSTSLSDGRTVESKVDEVIAPIDLTDAHWHIKVEDWKPAHPYATTVGPLAAETLKQFIALEMNRLKPWSQIAELKNVSGVGTYSTEFTLPESWSSKDGARLSLGGVCDTFSVRVNGIDVAFDQLSNSADIGTYLKKGSNTIEVRVTTTLNNRLAALDEDVAERGVNQAYGLLGPVVLSPYRKVTVWNQGDLRTSAR